MTGRGQNKYIYAAFTICAILLAFVFIQGRGVEGGLDSWEHYLISRCAIRHPELLIHQWNKPVFTWCTVLVCQGGFNALVIFNILCVLLSGLLMAFAFKGQGFRNAWVLIPFTVFIPVIFQNTISGLTEPLNALWVSMVVYFWSREKYKASVALASFLPYVRTEGFVICGAVFLMILWRREYKLILWLMLGSVIMDIVGFVITGEPLWIITSNPYWKQETEGTFDPGSGSFLHFARQGRALFGLPMELLFVAANVLWIYLLVKKEKIMQVFTMSLLICWLYFLAHSAIYYLGILGSHGLTRVMAVMAPALAAVGFFTLDYLTRKMHHQYRIPLFAAMALLVIWVGYKETGYPKPHRFREVTVKPDKTQRNFIRAGEWLQAQGLMDSTIIHQSPYFDVRFNKDPFDINSSYRIWSIDQKNDWAKIGVIVIWDGFSATREGNMKLEWLANNPNYKEIYFIPGFERPDDNPTMYDIHIFKKIDNKPLK